MALLVLLAAALSPVSPAEAQSPGSATLSVCSRTAQVRDAIVGAVRGVNNCADVTETDLAGIPFLGLFGSITTLREGDFAGLTAMTGLYLLENRRLTELPEGIFSDLGALVSLGLQENGLTELSPGVFSNLEISRSWPWRATD